MAKEPAADIDSSRSVLIPSELLSSLDTFVSKLRRSILAGAIACSERRGHGSESSIVSTDDLLAATRAVIPNALDELEKALAQRESSYARRAS